MDNEVESALRAVARAGRSKELFERLASDLPFWEVFSVYVERLRTQFEDWVQEKAQEIVEFGGDFYNDGGFGPDDLYLLDKIRFPDDLHGLADDRTSVLVRERAEEIRSQGGPPA